MGKDHSIYYKGVNEDNWGGTGEKAPVLILGKEKLQNNTKKQEGRISGKVVR